ncbi:Secretion protein HlyD, partial [mine drainage metagenome]
MAHAFRETVVYAHVPGYLQRLPVDKGDVLKKGDLIAKIFDPERDAALKREEALEAIAKLTYDREYAVWKKDPRVISLETVQKAEAKWKAARARALYEKTMTDYEVIRAPFDGMVTRRFVDPGNLIPEARLSTGGALPIIRLAEVRTIRIYVGVPARQVRFVKRGQPVEITVQGVPGRSLRAGSTDMHSISTA